MSITNKKIAIIGGGPGGLTLARLLQINGATVKVYERDKDRKVRVQGSTLDLHDDSGLKALEQGGLMDAFRENYRPGADLMRVTDKTAQIRYDQHEQGKGQDFGEAYFRPEIDRGPLRNILLDSLDPDTVVWNCHIVSISKVNGLWMLQFEDGTQVSADLVIGADGANSKIRKFVTDIVPVYSGVTMIEGTVYDAAQNAPRLWELTQGGKVFALGDNKTLVTSAKGDGSLSFYTGCKVDESWVKECGINFNDHRQLLEWFKETYKNWDKIWEELFTNDHTQFIPRPQYYMPLHQTWETQSDITIIGDAAHVMPPYAGEGVNMAMLDALELSECLTNSEYVEARDAIAAYEQRMRKRAFETTQMTLGQTETLHGPDALETLLDLFKN
ncbi:FAD-dependent oxidoreductase [Chitinophaga qingshengii]|uniref:Flavin-dependent monooxygenase n=1 Tax=Chitinophaga qingshengii TaxID=1569794 RepID=A0ABR7TT72_9BACT|nr:NAD(P)/FAD-dependent oxidoreductase [Chitinophaga qingshengii]MBC9932169.1 FAD-dependent monooxygenase [Chitinophaga qingshengii]